MEENKRQNKQTEKQTASENSLTSEQLQEVAGGASNNQFQETSSKGSNSAIPGVIPSNSTINRVHQRRLDQIDNPELAQ